MEILESAAEISTKLATIQQDMLKAALKGKVVDNKVKGNYESLGEELAELLEQSDLMKIELKKSYSVYMVKIKNYLYMKLNFTN